MERRHFLTLSLAAIACNGSSSTSSSIIQEGVPGEGLPDWPESQIDVPELESRLDGALAGTPFTDLSILGLLADWELRALARYAPETAKLGSTSIEQLIMPALEVAARLADPTLTDEDEMGEVLASAFDLSAAADALLPLFAGSETELQRLGAETTQGTSVCVDTLRKLAKEMRSQLQVAGREDNTFARQLILELDKLAIETRDDLSGGYARAQAALLAAQQGPPPPPFASLCTSIKTIADTFDRRRAAIAGLIRLVATSAWMTHDAIAAAWACASDPTDCPEELQELADADLEDYTDIGNLSVAIVPGGAIPLLVGIGVVAMLMPFYLYQPPTVYEPIHYRMCDCLGN